MSARRVAVVGAGYAGIAAAVGLARRGAAVTLYDANRTAGGRARRVPYREAALDNGQHVLLGAYRETLGLVRAVGAGEAGLRRLPLTVHYPGRLRLAASPLVAPLHLAAGLLFASGLTAGERLAAVRLSAALRRREDAALEGETVDAFLARLGQPGPLVALLWAPLCIAALNTPVASADARVFARVLHDALLGSRADSDLLVPATDLSALLPDPAIAWLTGKGAVVRLGERVKAITEKPGGWRVEGPAGEDFDAVVCATAPAEAAALLAPLPGLAPTARALAELPSEPITTVYLQFEDTVRLPFPMVGVDDGCAQWLFDREALGGPRGLVAAVISASRAEASLGHEALVARVEAAVSRAAGRTGSLRWSKVITEKRATFACTPGVVRPPVRTPVAGLALAGDYTEGPYPATLESAVTSGSRAADLIAERLELP